MFVVEQDQCGGDDVADAPGAAAPAAQRFEAGLEQAVGAFAEAAQGAVDGVVGLLVDGQLAAGGFLDRDAEQVGLAFVAQVGQAELAVVDPGGDLGEQVGVGVGGGGVVLAARRTSECCSRGGDASRSTTGPPRGSGPGWRSGRSGSACRPAPDR